MIQYKNIEFFTSSEGEILIRKNGNSVTELTEKNTEMIDAMFEHIRKNYPEAFDTLSHIYEASNKNFRYFRYLCVRRFIKCNFSPFDTAKEDIDNDGNFNFEYVACPMRGECVGFNKVCNPKFNTSLTERELHVLELYAGELMEMSDIASSLFLSPFTVETHIRNIRTKLEIKDKAGLVQFWQTKMK